MEICLGWARIRMSAMFFLTLLLLQVSLINFTLSNDRRFQLSMANLEGVKGLTTSRFPQRKFMLLVITCNNFVSQLSLVTLRNLYWKPLCEHPQSHSCQMYLSPSACCAPRYQGLILRVAVAGQLLPIVEHPESL